jgi:HEAT repeat protein
MNRHRSPSDDLQHHATRMFGLSLLLFWAASQSLSFSATLDPAFLDRAFAQLHTYTWGQPVDALVLLDEAIAATHDNPATRRQIEQRLLAILQTNAPVVAKQIACRKLALIGSRDSVPVLAALLTDTELSHMGRFALERIPDRAAASALREALPQTRGNLQVGVINSLGVLADSQAGPALAALLSQTDPDVAGAAAAALGKIGTLEAVRALEAFRPAAPEVLRPVVTEAYLAAAEAFVRRGDRGEAARIFRLFYERETGMLRLAGFAGLVQAEPERAVQLLSGALTGQDDLLRGLAARLIAELPGEQALQPFLDSWASLPADGQVALLDAVRARRDATARPTVLVACDSGQTSVRLAACRALALVGTAQDVPLLARLTAAGRGEESEAARTALAALPGRDASQAIAALLPQAAPSVRIELLRALAARSAAESVPVIVPRLEDSDAAVRLAALEALAVLGGEEQVPAAIACLKAAPDDATRSQAEKTLGALVTRGGSKCLEALLSGLPNATPPVQVVLLKQLGRLGGSRALAAVRTALGSDDAGLRDGAFRVLAEWPDWEAASDLLESAHRAELPAARSLAFRGYVRLCRTAPGTAADRLARVTEAARLATGTSEQMLVTSALAEVPEPGALKLLAAYLDTAALVEAASLAAVKVASALEPKHKDETVPMLQRVVKLCQNPDVQKQARETLGKLGAPAE